MPMKVRRSKPWLPVPPRPRPVSSARGYDSDWGVLSSMYREEHPICEVCGLALAALVHHVESVTARPDLRLDASNLQSVCRPCHAVIHSCDCHH